MVSDPWAAAQTRDVRTSSSRSDTTSTSTSSNTSGGGGGREGGDAPLLPVMDVGTQRDAATVGGVSQTWNPARSVCLFAWGFVMGAPLQKWFLFLSRLGGTPVTLPKVGVGTVSVSVRVHECGCYCVDSALCAFAEPGSRVCLVLSSPTPMAPQVILKVVLNQVPL